MQRGTSVLSDLGARVRLSGITPESLVDGPGLRYVIFTQGCTHCCPHCHNPQSWDANGGKEYSVKQIIRLIKQQKKTKRGLTFSCGYPFLQAAELAQVALAARQLGWDVVTYTGFEYEQLLEYENDGVKALLAASDILIDGKYVHKLRSAKLQFRGSSNQRIIDMGRTREEGRVALWKT
ncbi:MAG: anaerobic ribonucleoside-triphosphate reductase activating protein [Treponema sp.]|jgi:anaerobic ribonucleoside-triphosphate reductase activating protein|nr:anaerobic ribonucleoside-triphosphate reductase activating protein [Treponema sp.]